MIQLLQHFSRRWHFLVAILLLHVFPLSLFAASVGTPCVVTFQVEVLAGNILSAKADKHKQKEEGRNIKEIFITLKFHNEDLVVAFEKIERATGFVFSYNINDVKGKKVNGEFTNRSLFDILVSFSRQLGLNFRQYRDMINVKAGKPSRKAEAVEVGKIAHPVEGTVTDNVKGEPLPGVNVMVKDTNIGAVTDVNGKYSIVVPEEKNILVFSFIGFATQEVSINGRSVIDVALVEHVQSLDEVVVVGYGTQKKVNLTGAVSVVSGKELEGRGLGSVTEALQGTLANVNMVDSGLGEEPGTQNKSINIRGIGSLTGNGGSPYVLVDQMPMDISDIDPSDIESVTVLKDAAASAIYGARAPYGVILITTKKGSNNSRITANYSSNMSWATPTILPNAATSIDVAIAENYANRNSGIPPLYSDEYLDRIRAYLSGDFLDETIPRIDNPNHFGHHAANGGNANNDMMHLFWDNWALRQNHSLSFQGGSQNTNFYASAAIYDEGGMMTWGDEKYSRYNLSTTINSEITKWFRVNLMTKYIRRFVRQPRLPKGQDRTYAWQYAAVVEPMTPLYSPDGEIIMHGARETALGGRVNTYENDIWMKLRGIIEPIENWEIQFNYIFNNAGSKSTTHNKTIYYPFVAPGEFYAWRYPNPSFTEVYNNSDYNMIILRTSYQKSFGNNNFYVLAGFEQENKEWSSITGTKAGLVSNSVPSFSTALGEAVLDDSWIHWATRGGFARFTYNFAEKYLIEFNGRYDGSSRFENANTKWGFFPSASVGYVLSNEGFWSPLLNSINFFKVRASYGSLGNQNVPNYAYTPIFNIQPNVDWEMGGTRPSYTIPPGLVNSSLTWEKSSTLDIGMDAGLFEDKLELSFDWFQRTTSDMFGPAEELPSVLGASPSLRNNAELQTKGIDLSVGWRGNINNDLNYSVKFILGDNQTKIIKYSNPTNYIYSWYEGQTLGDVWGYETEGVFTSASEVTNHADQTALFQRWQEGDIMYKDLNGDGRIDWGSNTLDDHGDLKVIGNSNPRFQFGLNSNITYKSFDLSILLQGVGKRDFYITNDYGNTFFGFRGFSRFNSIFVEHLDYWSDDESHGGGTDAYYPRPYASREHLKNTQPQTKFLQNLAYLTLRNLQIGFKISDILPANIKISNARIYVTGRNILTLSSLKFLNPEAIVEDTASRGNGSYYPYAKFYSIGLDVQF